jgi:hypothetical protein
LSLLQFDPNLVAGMSAFDDAVIRDRASSSRSVMGGKLLPASAASILRHFGLKCYLQEQVPV